jgi:hypothetical protein
MASDRKELHELIEKIPSSEIEKIKWQLRKIVFDSQVEEVEPTEEEKLAIDEALKESENEETYSFEDVFGKDEL